MIASRVCDTFGRAQISALTAEDFPLGRLHNVVIAPKRSGDRGRKQPSSPPSAETTAKAKVARAAAAAATATGGSGGGQGCCRDSRRSVGCFV